MKQYSDMANFTRLSKPTWKAKLRAWLIDLVREAIRLEAENRNREAISKLERDVQKPLDKLWKERHPASSSITGILKSTWDAIDIPIAERSFEQMQAEALKAQEKYYEPVKN